MHEHKKARSRLYLKRIQRKRRVLLASAFVLAILTALYISSKIETLSPVGAVSAPTHEVQYIEKQVEVVKEVEVDRRFTSEKQQIMAYLIEKFGDRADDAITMINTCENSSFSSQTINKGNNNGTWDVGVMQINVDPKDTAEVERLKNYKYNIDRAYLKYKAHNNTFYLWSCGDRAGDYTYKMKLEGK